ncbi:MAG: hypothetical protein K9G24_05150 [Candidatus Nanopelagicales bacterium]|nr:hypothetical protein [Candidatus Nanopelagicales bacterium]MCF8542453.1 hypothetical protein [Candidatus Nanopelagicales bacterium]
MKSPDPLDPQRLEVMSARVDRAQGTVRVIVEFAYEEWWGEPGADVLWEQANALTCLREALQRGGVGSDF